MEKYLIRLFMWGFQRNFRNALQSNAERLFNLIDQELNPKVFILGVLYEQNQEQNRNIICLEPEDCGYSVNAFSKIESIVQQLVVTDEDRNLMQSHPVAQQHQDERIVNRAFIEAISKILKRDDYAAETEKFISYPNFVDGYRVFVVLTLNKQALKKYYSLTIEKPNGRQAVRTSFIQSAIKVYLSECTNSLYNPHRGIGAIERPADELMRVAASDFMYTVSNAGQNFDGLHGLFEACNAISSLRYEGGEGLGKIIFAKKDHPNIRYSLELSVPVRVDDSRKVRKLLELSNDSLLLISDSALIYGLGEQTRTYNPSTESLFVVKFISHYKWEVLHNDNSLMQVAYGQPSLAKDIIDRIKFSSDLERVFSGIDKKQINDLWDITILATKQTHGTMLLISDLASEEADRLGSQCFQLKPLKLTPTIINQFTSIDGAVLLDRNCVCHAIGVILDGLATDKGNSSRGARYNSAIRYYEYWGKKSPTLIIVISEDGMINIIPRLRPQINHSEIVKAITNLFALSELPKVNRGDFNKLMDFFKNIQFYLSQEECNEINELKKKIADNDRDIEGFKILWQDLHPNTEMNTSYYLDE
ncbi:MAG: diadenylate cyclase [Bacteroidota bacterium]